MTDADAPINPRTVPDRRGPLRSRLLRPIVRMLSWRPDGRVRVPVILQMSQVECAAACLAMVLSYFGRATRIADCRESCGVGRDGATAQRLAEAARGHGLRVRAFSVEPAALSSAPLPAIVHWNFNHFVVVERWTPRRVTIVDPAVGRRRVTSAEFDAAFTGVVLVLEPGASFERRRPHTRSPWRSYCASVLGMTGARTLLLQILAASLVMQVLGLALPVFTAVLIDRVLRERATHLIPILGAGMALLVLTQLVTSYLRAALLIYVQGRLDARLMRSFFQHLLALPFRFFAQRTSGDLLMRLASNSIMRELLTGQTLAAVLDGSLVIVYVAVVASRDFLFGAMVLVVGALHALLLLGSARWSRDLVQRHLVAQAASQSFLHEALAGIATLKASGAEDRALARWSNLFTVELNAGLRRSHLAALLESGRAALSLFSPMLLLWVGAQRVLDGSLSLGAMLALTSLAGAALASLTSLMANAERLQLAGAHLERLDDVLEAEPEQGLAPLIPVPRVSGRIELQHVSFRYDDAAPWVLHDVTLTIEPGQKVALVGATGSGKSTLGRLLLGLFEPTEGVVRYDGVPLGGFNYRALRQRFGVVLQESMLFSDSIERNIAFNDPSLSTAEVIDAARIAAIDEDIARMPMGYDTIVGEGGGSLSGGQVQRVAIARAIAHHPAVLLLDEATSHLDRETERHVDRNLSALACTRIVIAHRLSTVRNADLIVVIDRETIVESGRHGELMARRGHYAALVGDELGSDRAAKQARHAMRPTIARCHFCAWCGTPARRNNRYCVGCGAAHGRCAGRQTPHVVSVNGAAAHPRR